MTSGINPPIGSPKRSVMKYITSSICIRIGVNVTISNQVVTHLPEVDMFISLFNHVTNNIVITNPKGTVSPPLISTIQRITFTSPLESLSPNKSAWPNSK